MRINKHGIELKIYEHLRWIFLFTDLPDGTDYSKSVDFTMKST